MIITKAATAFALVFIGFLPKNDLHFNSEFTAPEKQAMLEAVNRLRSKGCHCGRKYMPPVGSIRWNAKLEKAALDHANDMRRNGFFAHKGANGSNIGEQAERAGYRWRAVGENIAEGYGSFEATLQAWKDSPGHCRNLMNGGYDEMGVSMLGDIWVQDFGARVGEYERFGK